MLISPLNLLQDLPKSNEIDDSVGSTTMKEFRTDCLVPAPIETCFQVLTDFDHYEEWSSAHHKVIAKGDELKLFLRREDPNNQKPVVLGAQIRQSQAPHHLAWGGGLAWAPWIIDIHHYFELEAAGDQTKFVHGEIFRGILGHSFAALRVELQLKQYRRFNESFSKRCAQVHTGSTNA